MQLVDPRSVLLVALFGGAGCAARYVGAAAFNAAVPVSMPLGTLVVNVLGSFIIGVVWGLSRSGNALDPHIRDAVAAGFCGGFTTFSSFSAESLRLFHEGRALHAGLYMVGNVGLCLAATALGLALVSRAPAGG